MIWESDHMVRRIFMTDQHSETVSLSWFGESIGYYEGGDTLVVDTIRLQVDNSFLDWFRTLLPILRKEHMRITTKLIHHGGGRRDTVVPASHDRATRVRGRAFRSSRTRL
jgi:hypothetical protein